MSDRIRESIGEVFFPVCCGFIDIGKDDVWMAVRLMIGADIVPTKNNFKYFRNGDMEHLTGEGLEKLLREADFTAFNLEVPLTDKISPIEKAGPNLIAPPDTIEGLKKINPYFFTLANNHILDQGKQGLFSTLRLLDGAGIDHAGAGKDLGEASRRYVKKIGEINLGIYCCAEHEFTIASETDAGANPFDVLESLDHITYLKRQCDYAVVLYHGGKEHYRYPSPYLQKVCRKMVDKGADLVVCQHTHSVGCEEEWNGGRIVYGQGNFLFDNCDNEFWQTGLLIDVQIGKNGSVVSHEVTYHPLRKTTGGVRLAEDSEKEEILSAFFGRSAEIMDPAAVVEHYKEFAVSMLPGYLCTFSGRRGLLSRAVNKLSGYRFYKWEMAHRYGTKHRIALRNYVECEAHRELVLQGIRDEVVR